MHTYTHTDIHTPQLRFIHIHQLFIIHYTLFQVDTVNIYWWWCIDYCRVHTNCITSRAPPEAPGNACNDNIHSDNVDNCYICIL